MENKLSRMDVLRGAAEAIRNTLGTAEIGLVLGSGLGGFVDALSSKACMDAAQIPGYPTSSAPGHAGKWWVGTLAGRRVYMLQGRVHFYEGRPMDDVTMYVRLMKLLGVKALILTNAAGCVNTDWKPGNLMLINDFINFNGWNPLIGPNLDEMGPRFPDMSVTCDPTLRSECLAQAQRLGIPLRQGIYMWFSGPSYETPAEVRMARLLGADAVGMSTVPELIVARHCGLPAMGISCLTNMATGILAQPLSHSEVTEAAAQAQASFQALLAGLIGGVKLP